MRLGGKVIVDVAERPKRSRLRLFVENMLVYGLGGVLGKLVPLVMLPVVTRLMPGTSYFGLSDLSNTLVSFGQAFAIMGMYDAMFRMFFERDDYDYKKSVCTTALLFVTGCSLAVAVGMLLLTNPIARLFFGGVEFSSLVVISAISVLVGGNSAIIQAPTRMQNKKTTFIVLNLVTSVLSYAISIPMILAGQYLMALPLAALIASASALIVFYFLNRKWFSIRLFDKKLLREMLAIGVPLMPTFLFYWIFNSADRLMIVNMLGSDAAGVYAVAAKLGHVSQLIYTGFSQGWQYFAFSTMRDDDQVELNSRVYEYLGIVSFFATALLLVVLKPVYGLLFPARYVEGVYSVPYLFLAPLLLMLYQVAANQLLVVKKTWPALIVLLLGACVNLIVNWLLIPILGIEGASIATFFGYVVTNIGILIMLVHMGLLTVRLRLAIVAILYMLYLCFWRFGLLANWLVMCAGFLVFSAFLFFMYRDDVKGIRERIGGMAK